jgi:glycosyltransferase involved in cell wall biosynthesis
MPNLPSPKIAAPTLLHPRPFWSVMIPLYNRTQFLETTLRSVLAQDPGADDMQIEVVDDASTTGDFEPEVRRIAGDRVRFFRQPRNLGLTGNWNSCVERSVGRWVHILHTDDFVMPGFYERFKSAIHSREDVGAAFCRNIFVDQAGAQLRASPLESSSSGALQGFVETIGISQRISCPAIVVRRKVYENLGGYRMDLRFTPDWEMWTRIAAQYPIWYEPEVLAAYRVHSDSYTAQLAERGQLFSDMRRCIEICHSYLPSEQADAISEKARDEVALWALSLAEGACRGAQFGAALRYLREGLRTSASPSVIKELLLCGLRVPRGGARRVFRMFGRRSVGLSS